MPLHFKQSSSCDNCNADLYGKDSRTFSYRNRRFIVCRDSTKTGNIPYGETTTDPEYCLKQHKAIIDELASNPKSAFHQ